MISELTPLSINSLYSFPIYTFLNHNVFYSMHQNVNAQEELEKCLIPECILFGL